MDTSKIIKGAVSNGRYTVTAPIVKEDYGLYLQIEGVELPSTYEVDFSNSEHNGTSVTMIGNSDGVLIPSQFISTGKDVFAFLYHVGADYGRTVYKFRIPNKLRPDRTNEEPTPEEQSTIDQAISALNSAVEQTAQDVINADASAQASAESAQASGESALSASNSALSAGEYASNALGYAESASASATASAQSASQSAQIKSDVEDLVDDAQGYAQASAQSASASANSASQAQGYAQSASASAQSASGYASNAQTSANTASNKASEASQSASTASTKATEASQSASQALSYKTDAESAKTASQTAQGLAESARDTAVQAKTDAESARDEAQNLVDGISGKVEQIDANTASVASLEEDRYKPYVVDSASGSIASFSDGADDLPLKSLVVDINPIQDLSHGDPSPENICPISGWTGAQVVRTGKNLFDLDAFLDSAGATYTKDGDEYTIESKVTLCLNPYEFLGEDATITFSCADFENLTSAGVRVTFLRAGGTTTIYAVGTAITRTVTASKIRFDWASSGAFKIKAPQIELGSIATSYKPFTGRSITIDLGQTVYGGKLDVLSGVLTVDRAMVDLGTLTWEYNGARFNSTVPDITLANTRLKGICSQYATFNGDVSSAPDCSIIFGTLNSRAVYVKDSKYADTTTFKTAMDGVQCCYDLATPITIQLTPNQINTLLGVNNIWADSGDTEAVYRADTKAYIAKKIAEVISALS